MECPNCKNEITNNSLICSTCGYAIWGNEDENTITKIKEKNISAVNEIKGKNYKRAVELLNSAIKDYESFENYINSANDNVIISHTKSYEYAYFLYLNYGVVYSSCDSPYYNLTNAIKYFEKSSAMGHSNGYFQIASIYDHNFDIGKKEKYKDIEKAKGWYKKAINLDGDYYAVNNLGVLYGNNGDYKLGAFYCWVAFKLGNQGALANYNTYLSNLSVEYDKYFKSLSITKDNIFTLETAFLTWHQNFGKASINKGTAFQNHLERNKKKYIIGTIAVCLSIFLLVFGVLVPHLINSDGGGGGSNDTRRCGSCHKTFERYDIWGDLDDDYSSIQLRGMCERCYENYKWIHGK